MKILVATLFLAALLCCLCGFSDAAVSIEYCPTDNIEDCQAYAEEQSNKMEYCHRYMVNESSPPTIQYQSCGAVSCGENAEIVPEDTSKPYPDCCKTCKKVDDCETSEAYAG